MTLLNVLTAALRGPAAQRAEGFRVSGYKPSRVREQMQLQLLLCTSLLGIIGLHFWTLKTVNPRPAVCGP